jgi:serine/threonine protein kinase
VRGRLRILDFGLAQQEGLERLTLTGDILGTVFYMSPEQAVSRRGPVDSQPALCSPSGASGLKWS